MEPQPLLVLLAALGALGWLLRDALRGACASGCGACAKKSCPAKTLQALADRPRP